MSHIVKQHFSIRVSHKEWKRAENGLGLTRVGPEDTWERVVIVLDLQTLANQLGLRAVKNKGGKSRALNGLIQVKHFRKKDGEVKS